MNPSFKPPIPISASRKRQIYAKYIYDPVIYSPRHLSAMFNISLKRIDAILRLQGLEAHFIEASFLFWTLKLDTRPIDDDLNRLVLKTTSWLNYFTCMAFWISSYYLSQSYITNFILLYRWSDSSWSGANVNWPSVKQKKPLQTGYQEGMEAILGVENADDLSISRNLDTPSTEASTRDASRDVIEADRLDQLTSEIADQTASDKLRSRYRREFWEAHLEYEVSSWNDWSMMISSLIRYQGSLGSFVASGDHQKQE